MATPNAEMQAKKAEWDAIYGATLVDLNDNGPDFGYRTAAERHMPFNTWQISYGFADGPFKGAPIRVVAIWQIAADPTRFIANYSVTDNRTNFLTLP